ncbi:hypothetical protein EXIGLDRAFT_730175 [Exidia glandulosa HHB12029]|uniref:Uncharacterized protein n=1 Tax=Exidia glandulosa HHB12029 TaxID=1314781 RepID=A0A165ZF24_EXIGL|nr:hypothetical protein EXIGLDRAFT_730175 [Exidia glandulosa HHB12029]
MSWTLTRSAPDVMAGWLASDDPDPGEPLSMASVAVLTAAYEVAGHLLGGRLPASRAAYT